MQLKNYFMYFVLLFLVGCSTLGGSNIDTPRKQLALADAQLTAVINTASDLRQAGLIDDATRAKLNVAFQQGNTIMDAAWIALGKGDITEANNKLQMVNTLLWNIRALLPKQGGTP